MTTLPTITGLGTTWWIEIFDELTSEKTQIVYDDLRFFITNFNNKYSRFQSESIISLLNDTRHILKPDTETLDILRYGLTLYQETHGVFNFLVGQAMQHNGYDAVYSFTPKEDSVLTPDPTHALTLHEDKIILTLGQIDIGGYGKGYLIDMIAAHLTDKHGVKEFLINGGGDMYATSEHGKPVTIYLEHPTIPRSYIEETTLFYEGFAASSTHKRRWESGGTTYSHIIDTKLGESSLNGLGIFVKAPTARAADAWATTLVISAPENHQEALVRGKIKAALYDEHEKTLRKYGEF